MNQKMRAVIWDMGGVIMRGGELSSRAQLVKRLGMEQAALEALVFNSPSARQALLGQISEDEHWLQVGKALGVEGEALAQARREFWSTSHMDAELVAFIDSLRPTYRTGLLSNAWPGTRQSVGARYAFLHVFDVSVFSDEIGMMKPDPAFYSWILERLDVRPEEAVFIDDQSRNVAAAVNLGMSAIRFESRVQTVNALRQMLPEIQHNPGAEDKSS